MTDSYTYAPVVAKRTRVANFFIKREASRGVWLKPNSGDALTGTDAVLIDASGSPVSITSNLIEINPVRGSLDKFTSIPSGSMCEIKGKLDIRGTLNAAGVAVPGVVPEWDVIAEICGLHSVVTKTDVVDALTTVAAATATLPATLSTSTSVDPFTGITVGSVLNISGSANAANNNDFLVVGLAAKVISLVAIDGTPAGIVAESSGVSLTLRTGIAGKAATAGTTTTATLAAPFAATADLYRYMPVLLTGANGAAGTATITSNGLSWTKTGAILASTVTAELGPIKPGMYLKLGGGFAAGTKGVYIVKLVTDSTHVVLQHVDGTTAAMDDDAGPITAGTIEYGIPPVWSVIKDYTVGRVASLVDVVGSALTTSTVVSVPANVVYSPTSDSTNNLPTASVRMQMDGVEYQFYGCTGTVDFDAPTGNSSSGIASLTFDIKGLFHDYIDAAVLTVAYPPGAYPVNRGGVVLLNGVQIASKTLSVKSNAKLVNPDNPNSPEGYDPGVMTERRYETTVDPLRISKANRDFIAQIRSNTFYTLHNRFSTPGRHTPGASIALTVPRWSARTLSQSDDGGLQRDQAMGQTDGLDTSTLGITLW